MQDLAADAAPHASAVPLQHPLPRHCNTTFATLGTALRLRPFQGHCWYLYHKAFEDHDMDFPAPQVSYLLKVLSCIFDEMVMLLMEQRSLLTNKSDRSISKCRGMINSGYFTISDDVLVPKSTSFEFDSRNTRVSLTIVHTHSFLPYPVPICLHQCLPPRLRPSNPLGYSLFFPRA